jgi:hypothetical protein
MFESRQQCRRLIVYSGQLASVSPRKRRASGLLPRLAFLAVPEVGAPLLPDRRASLSGEHGCHPQIRVRHDALAGCLC